MRWVKDEVVVAEERKQSRRDLLRGCAMVVVRCAREHSDRVW